MSSGVILLDYIASSGTESDVGSLACTSICLILGFDVCRGYIVEYECETYRPSIYHSHTSNHTHTHTRRTPRDLCTLPKNTRRFMWFGIPAYVHGPRENALLTLILYANHGKLPNYPSPKSSHWLACNGHIRLNRKYKTNTQHVFGWLDVW